MIKSLKGEGRGRGECWLLELLGHPVREASIEMTITSVVVVVVLLVIVRDYKCIVT